jgi:outer membrane receptor protein involved in Fe transport
VAAATSFSFNRVKMQGSLLGTFVHEKTKVANSAAGNRQEYTPTIIVAWQPWKNQDLNIRAFYKRIFRMPTLNDLYYTFIGNKYLDPEYTTQYDLGLTYSHDFKGALRRIEGQVDAYFNQVKNKIIAMPTSNQFRWTMINLGYTEIRGLDVSVQTRWQLSKEILMDARLSYTYQKAQDFTDPSSPYYGGQIPYVPWHSGSVVLGPSYKTWNVNYSFMYTGERYEAVANIPENYSKPWYTHDISISKRFIDKKREWRCTAEVNNILNQQYEVVQWYPMPGINYKLIVSVTL